MTEVTVVQTESVASKLIKAPFKITGLCVGVSLVATAAITVGTVSILSNALKPKKIIIHESND